MTATDAPIADRLAALRAGNPRVRVGIGGWTYAAWRGNFYPADLPQRRELEYASRQLTAIEINGTFYGAQKPAIYARWAASTPDGFVFSVKAPRYVAERTALASAGEAIEHFVFRGLGELGDRLGPILWQLPPSRHYDADDCAAFLKLLPAELAGRRLRHVLEVRHASFLCTQYLDLARAHRVATVCTDSAEHPSFADLTGDFVYLRLKRSQPAIATGYDAGALDAWARRARTWSAGDEPDDLPRIAPPSDRHRSPRDVFVYFIDSAKVNNPAAAAALIARIGP